MGVVRDARRLPAAKQEALRRAAIAQVRAGRTTTESAVLYGVPRRGAANWCRRQTAGGDAAVAARVRSRWGAEPRALTPDQEVALVEALRDHLPDQVGLPGYLWTRRGVADMIEQMFGVVVGPQAVGGYLRSWGLGPREPAERACALCAAAVGRWLERDYPRVSRAAQEAGSPLCWLGRNRLCGIVPAAEVISAVTIPDGIRFMIAEGTSSRARSFEFLTRLARHEDRRHVHVIADGSWTRTHRPRRLPAGIRLHAMPSCERGAA